MTERDKVTVDDIIGLVDCEPTNSVEEVKKLRGRENRTEKRFEIKKSAIIDGARVIKDNENKYTFATTFETATLINYRKALNELNDENEQLKQRCKELRNDLIDHSALINMLEKVKALNIEDIIWNTMGYKTQTEFDDDFADYREYAKKRWKE